MQTKKIYLTLEFQEALISLLKKLIDFKCDFIILQQGKQDERTFTSFINEVLILFKDKTTKLMIEKSTPNHNYCMEINSHNQISNYSEWNPMKMKESILLKVSNFKDVQLGFSNGFKNLFITSVDNFTKNQLEQVNKLTKSIIIKELSLEKMLGINPNFFKGIAIHFCDHTIEKLKTLFANLSELNINFIENILLKEKANYIDIKVIKSGFSNNLNATFKNGNNTKIIKIFCDSNKVEQESIGLKIFNLKHVKGINFIIRDFLNEDNSNELNPLQAKHIVANLHKLHLAKIEGIPNFDYDVYDEYISAIKKEKYLSIKTKLKTMPQVLIHGDINRGNLLQSENQVQLIDFEWLCKGAALIDFAYLGLFLPETLQYIKEPFLEEAMYFIKHHTIGWCLRENSEKSFKLLKWIERNL